uniref:NADH dehydrogenase subunit 2 n=1 Tax=Dictyotopsis propagulifera TaxID=670095 RepID=UPI002E75CF75|nr:NADH dehydrogenase subunit 2 [Dictyotopsis propagulifera]WBP69959.1 NADH dehydrogenase subunit 2 [Dictyotopsis propagulifera]
MNKINFLLFQLDVISLFPEIFLAFSFLIILLYGCFQVVIATKLYTYLNPIIARLTLISLILSLILLCNNPVIIFQTIWNGTFVIDDSSVILKIIVILSIIFCLLLVEDYLFLAKIRPYEIFVFFIGIALSLFLLISSYDLLSIYLNLEFLSLIFYILAAWKKSSSFSAEAGLKYFILGSLASIFFLFGASFIYLATGTTNLGALALIFDKLNAFSIIIGLGLTCLVSSLLFKLGCAPYHMWVIDIYEGSPTIVGLTFASVPKIALISVILKLVFISSWNFFYDLWENLFLSCALLSLFFGSLGGLGEIKLKRVLGYSAIGHIGFVCLGLACGNLEGIHSVFMYIFIYILTSIYMWAYLLYLKPTKKKLLSLVDSVGLMRSNPILAFITCLMFFSLAGIPPFGGFFAKMLVFLALIDSYFFIVCILAIFASVISAFYYVRLIKILYFEKSKTWIHFYSLTKTHAFVLSLVSFITLFFVCNPNIFYLIAYKLSLSFFI